MNEYKENPAIPLTIGILAGMGPRSTSPFIDLVITECQRQYGARHDIDFPRIMICSQPAPFYEDRPVDHAALENAIRDGLQHLERSGVDFLAIACNTAHVYYLNLKQGVRVPLLNMVELTVTAIPKNVGKVALIAARPTTESGVYHSCLRARGIEVVDIDWQSDIDRLLSATRDSTDPRLFEQLWAGLMDQAHTADVDTIVLACLDLSGVAVHARTAIPIVDASHCLAKAIVARWLRRRNGGQLAYE